ncbi:SDR family oxidoreductase [Flavobacteriaceae bacterium]|jgi:NAD(P)-dependent dehydrogenase (short-subunit alcohol dehydrogenase family)|nr:SDR family oxidoreductase [Flavobacteriaceae bacterium]MDB4134900.1 SDR family oxidoreductase [Flavobacteriaceae bacterium]MDB4179811.1 SDR family oxidoreductase [Flavobacteriaceae bacterium]MDB4196234.1 SDR family oxidoreductase [Flavobacteriaceae bacterium]MDC0552224.1 SDR family oxidoreductase [Flavobacteriaceae bacterium]|tara:strand:+ start:50 stop:733 length:684 start_codon:yes stop_codon:yes gene_type:complete
MNKIVIVGGSRGIGKEIINQLVQDNMIINLSRNKPELTHTNLTHHNIDILSSDLPDLEDVSSVIYCPGSINLKPIGRISLDEFREDFEINVVGAIKVIQKYLPILKKSNHASILLFSTVATKLGMPYHSSVAASKSAIDGLVKTLGAELAPKIRVNAIAPTITKTDLASKLLRNEKVIENMIERHPLKKILMPEEVAKMAKFLISNDASSISGQIFNLDAGIVSFKL